MSKKAMKISDPYTSLMECKTCGSKHLAMLKPSTEGGGFYRGAWKCSWELCPTNIKAD